MYGSQLIELLNFSEAEASEIFWSRPAPAEARASETGHVSLRDMGQVFYALMKQACRLG